MPGAFLLLTRLLLLLVFGSRPGDQTEGTFVGISDATNMAVIPLGLNNINKNGKLIALTSNNPTTK